MWLCFKSTISLPKKMLVTKSQDNRIVVFNIPSSQPGRLLSEFQVQGGLPVLTLMPVSVFSLSYCQTQSTVEAGIDGGPELSMRAKQKCKHVHVNPEKTAPDPGGQTP